MAATSALQTQFRFETASPVFVRCAVLFFAGFIAVYGATFIDARLLNGVSVWEKPAKFFLSLGIHMATLAWGISLLPEAAHDSKAIRRATLVFIAAAAFEMVYMIAQAARGEASHFNTSTPITAALFAIMGIGAVTLTAVTGFIGWRIFRSGRSAMHFAAGAGFIASAVATVAVAGVMSSGASHWIGGDQTDATGLPFFHWSTTGGDLRPAHFAALHIMQAVPLIAWFWPDKRVAAASLAAGLAAVAALFVQASMRIPLFGA